MKIGLTLFALLATVASAASAQTDPDESEPSDPDGIGTTSPPVLPSTNPTVGKAFAHVTTGHLDKMAACSDTTAVTPPPNGVTPPPPVGAGLSAPLASFEG